jgi:anti-sigma factor RsiW
MNPPQPPDCGAIQDLLGAYALDAVDPEEAARVDEHLASCPRCRQEVDEHRTTMVALAAGGGPAPDQVWDRIAGAIGASGSPDVSPPPELLLVSGAAKPRSGSWRSRWSRPLQVGAVAAAVAVAVLVGVQTVRIADLQHQVNRTTAAGAQADSRLAAALVDPSAQHLSLASTAAGRPVAQLVVLPSGAAYMVGSTLPELSTSRIYQLWGMVGGRFVSLSLLGRHPVTVAFNTDPAVPAEAYLVTVEPAGGTVSPTTAPVAKATA